MSGNPGEVEPGRVHKSVAKGESPPRIKVLDYSDSDFEEREFQDVEECFSYKGKPTVTWIDVSGLEPIENIEKLGAHFDIHPLLVEDVTETDQRPKLEDFEDYLLIILKMLSYDEEEREIDIEQVSLILGSDFVISFQEKRGDVFESVRDRIRKGKGRTRSSGADYLTYRLIDAIVDRYFHILENISDRIEDLEEELVNRPTTESLQVLHDFKREMIFLRKSVWPLREVLSAMTRREMDLIQDSTIIYLRDVYDHTIQVIDTIEALRDILSGMLDIYLSSISNRMNEVMKVLTVIATVFIPLTFIAGVYGMNFMFMPELEIPWAYPAVIALMLAIALAMILYFRNKEWL